MPATAGSFRRKSAINNATTQIGQCFKLSTTLRFRGQMNHRPSPDRDIGLAVALGVTIGEFAGQFFFGQHAARISEASHPLFCIGVFGNEMETRKIDVQPIRRRAISVTGSNPTVKKPTKSNSSILFLSLRPTRLATIRYKLIL